MILKYVMTFHGYAKPQKHIHQLVIAQVLVGPASMPREVKSCGSY